MQKDVIVSAVLATSTTAQPRAREISSLMRVGEQTFSSPYTVRVKRVEPIPDTDQVAVTFLVTGEDAPAHEFTETGNQVVAAFLDAAMRANPAGADGITVQKIEAVAGDHGNHGNHGADATADERTGAGRAASATPAPTSAPPQPTSTITPEAPAGDVPTLPVAPPITAERPTTAPSSPVQGQSQRGEHAGAEEVSEGGPFPDAPPPDRS